MDVVASMGMMRTEREMLDLIMRTAQNDERICAVIMNGSRVNPNAPRDIFQDFDIVFVVTAVTPFRQNPNWIDQFGELMILQTPDEMEEPSAGDDDPFAYLMQFADGNRIDLTLYPIAKIDQLAKDSLSLLLLDKDGIIEPFPPPNESSYLPKPPTAKEYFNRCNEFWWICTYVAKGLWREELTYAKGFEGVVREQLLKMLTWHIGIKTQFAQNSGKMGKYFKQYLTPEQWQMLQKTYADADFDNCWDALEVMGRLFRETAVSVATHFNFNYPHADDKKVTTHLNHVRSLPKDAKGMY